MEPILRVANDDLELVRAARAALREQHDFVERLRLLISKHEEADRAYAENMLLLEKVGPEDEWKPLVRAACNAAIASIDAFKQGITLVKTGEEGWPVALEKAEAGLQEAEARLAEAEDAFVKNEQARAQKDAQSALDGLK